MEALDLVEKFVPNKNEKKWFASLSKLPKELREILRKELSLGNKLGSIQSANWPQSGSLVIHLLSHFKSGLPPIDSLVKYEKLNDPHYWYEELSLTENGVEHLLIT